MIEAVEEKLTIAPPPAGIIARAACLQQNIMPLRCVFTIASNSSSVISSPQRPPGLPATWIDASILPKAIKRAGEHGLDIGLAGHVAMAGERRFAKFACGVVLRAAECR